MRFVWDEKKERANQTEQGVSFELARLVFDDPHAISLRDDCKIKERWFTIGLVKVLVILLVVHTSENEDHDEIIRIISA
jgi:uncharacterized DUF497 family protein